MALRFFKSDTDPVIETSDGRVFLWDMGEWRRVDRSILTRPSSNEYSRQNIEERVGPAGIEAMNALEVES